MPFKKYHLLPLFLALLVPISLLRFNSQPTQSTHRLMPKVAVTGSNGSVGRRVVLRALERGYHVVGIDHTALVTADDHALGANFTFAQVDLRDFDETLKALEGCDAIIHLAALARPGDYKVRVHNTNVVMSWNVLRAAAELGINRIAQASSVNVLRALFAKEQHFEFFPIDESHPCLPDEPYGLSKVISELQADTIVRRYPDMRVANLRLHWSVPNRTFVQQAELSESDRKNDLWGYVQEDSAAEAFLLAITGDTDKWPSAAESFFIVAPETTFDGETGELLRKHWPNVPVREGKIAGGAGLFDCTKAKQLLGWEHNPNIVV